MTGSIISTGMCMAGTVFMGRRFWMSDAGQTVTTASFTVTTSMEGRYFGYLQNFREEAFFMKHPVFFFTPVDGKEERYHIISVLETDKYAEYYSHSRIMAMKKIITDGGENPKSQQI